MIDTRRIEDLLHDEVARVGKGASGAMRPGLVEQSWQRDEAPGVLHAIDGAAAPALARVRPGAVHGR